MPTQAFGVYAAEGTAGDEVSSTYEGRHITVTAAELLTSDGSGVATKGLPCVFGIIAGNHGVGVCLGTGTLTDLIAVDTEGIWDLSVVATDDAGASLVTGGDPLYINTTTGIISKIRNNATQIPFGYALGQVEAAATAVIAVKVHWDPRSHWLEDDEMLYFGDARDVSVEWDGTNLEWLPVADQTGIFAIGNGTLSMDFKVFGTTANSYMLYDVSGDMLINMHVESVLGAGTDRTNLRSILGYTDFQCVQTDGGGWQIINGISGLVNVTGTLYGSTTFVCGMFAQVYGDGTLTEVSHMCALWADYAAASGAPTTGSSEILYLTSGAAGAGLTLSSAIHIALHPSEHEVGAECIFYFENCYFGGASGTPIRDGGTGDKTVETGGDWKKIAVSIDGTIYWLVAMTDPTESA